MRVLTDASESRLNLGDLAAAPGSEPKVRVGHPSGEIGPENGKTIAQFSVLLVSARH